MEDRSPSSSNTAEKGDSQKQAACLNCRKSKTRCMRNPGDVKCKKCTQAPAECVIPEDYRVGRKKGIKNKRDGLSKAVFAIEQALKKSRTKSSQSEEDRNTFHLQNLLSEAQGLLPQRLETDEAEQSRNGDLPIQQYSQVNRHSMPDPGPDGSVDDQFAVDDAENPLQLLARASDLSAPTAQAIYTNATMHHQPSRLSNNQDLQSFFGPFRPSIDVGPDIDPIDMGLVTDEEAAALFAYFYDNLSHTRWGLDAKLHTPEFIRKQSSFLFTSIMAASALFLPTATAISKRLSTHSKRLGQSIMVNRHRSPEIILGFMVNIPWMSPGKHWADDETCSYMGAALRISIDISLNKLIVPSPSPSLAGIHERRPPSDYISARKALDLDGFYDVDPVSDFGRRLLRRRERIWLALFVLDRGVCLARGRGFTVPLTPIIEHCDNWHQSDIADIWDGSMVSSAMLRRDLEVLISDVKKTCDGNGLCAMNGNNIAQSLQHMIDGFFTNWYSTWAFATGGMKDNSIPPYVEILVTHGRLSIYSSVINHPTAPVEVKRFFRAAGLSSALNVMRAAVQGENRLKSMPNNTAIMISFAACFAFYLSTMGAAGNMSLAPSIRKLIEETAALLERIGSNPTHRNGTSTLYGRHLREVVDSSLSWPNGSAQSRPQQTTFSIPQNATIQPQMQTYQDQANVPPIQMSELLPFSAMSDNQINEAINNAGDELEMYLPNFQMADSRLDWLDSMDWFNMDVGMNG